MPIYEDLQFFKKMLTERQNKLKNLESWNKYR